jgi:hypothetical protein
MRTINRPRFQTATTDRARRPEPRADRESARRANPHLISEAIVASYLHDISQRHRPAIAAETNRAHADAHPTPEVAS